MHTFYPSTGKAEAGIIFVSTKPAWSIDQVPAQSGIQRNHVLKNQNQITNKNYKNKNTTHTITIHLKCDHRNFYHYTIINLAASEFFLKNIVFSL